MKIAVIGSGIGGIAVACRLAAKGHNVTVFEKNLQPGGKIGELRIEGYRFDTGPSLLTLPHMMDELLNITGGGSKHSFDYKKLEILCKYFFLNSEPLTAYADLEKFKNECLLKFNEDPENISRYLAKASLLYKLTSEIFLFNSLHKLKNYLKISILKSLLQVNKLRFYNTMHYENNLSFASRNLVQIFDRYATYNGSNPYSAPATLIVIAHLENNLGAYFPSSGMYSIVQSLSELAIQLGVDFNFNTLVDEIVIKNNKAVGIKVDEKELSFDMIVADADVKYLANNMMNHPLKKRLNRMEPSSSALVFYWGVKKVFPELDLHNILFSADYREEFIKLFREKTIYNDPTIYIFISSKLVKDDAPMNSENWFVMINAPYDTNQDWEKLIKEARKNIVEKINHTLNTDLEKFIEYEKIATPQTIQRNTLSQGGALYGSASNSIFSAFLRHPNFLHRIKNLYFVGGSVHPGGGIPLCLASAKIVDNEIPAK